MKIGSIFTGIGGFDLAFERQGFTCAWQVEIDRDCNRVLSRHWPNVRRIADVKDASRANLSEVDVIAFGSPCQDLSVAGKRAGLSGERSGLFYEAMRIVRELGPAFVVWENVPGALSSNSGRDFRAVLNTFRECGARDVAWRTLDAQYSGVPQRRRRVFVVGDFRGERAAEILFESASVCRHSPPRRETGAGVAPVASTGVGVNGEGAGIARALTSCQTATGRLDPNEQTFVVSTLINSSARGVPSVEEAAGGQLIVGTMKSNGDAHSGFEYGDGLTVSTLIDSSARGVPSAEEAAGGQLIPVAFAHNTRDEVRIYNSDGQIAGALGAGTGALRKALYGSEEESKSADIITSKKSGGQRGVGSAYGVRRLTPL